MPKRCGRPLVAKKIETAAVSEQPAETTTVRRTRNRSAKIETAKEPHPDATDAKAMQHAQVVLQDLKKVDKFFGPEEQSSDNTPGKKNQCRGVFFRTFSGEHYYLLL